MTGVFASLRTYCNDVWEAWTRFWFTPADPATLSLIRVLAGGMLLYTHCIWSLDLEGFIGPDGWIPLERVRELQTLPGASAPQRSVWSIFFWIKSIGLLWAVHVFALIVFACLMLGFCSRVAAVAGYLLAVCYAQRVTPGAYFGLDKTNVMLAMYLMLGPCGARYSLDRIWRLRRGDQAKGEPSVSANVAIRLIQIHLCIIYLFSGIAKVQGPSWQAGTAIWGAVASYEYQSFDMTWMAGWPILIAVLTHATVIWELSYCWLVWPRLTRPLVLLTALAVHGGIAMFMGMITFGTAMLIANLAFVSPTIVRRFCDPLAARISLALVGRKVE